MYNILLIEDNKYIGEIVDEYLTTKKCTVNVSIKGETGLIQFQKSEYDLVLLDIMLPGISGIETLKQLRKISDTPIIMLTAKGSLDDKEEGFINGADDYLVKPFELKELRLRIQTLLKRTQSSDVFHIGDLFIDTNRNIITKNFKEIQLSSSEWIILSQLIYHKNRTVTRVELIDYIWGDDNLYTYSRALDVHISRLRAKIGKEYIQTVTGLGYQLGNDQKS